jgi:hypothetical protein
MLKALPDHKELVVQTKSQALEEMIRLARET